MSILNIKIDLEMETKFFSRLKLLFILKNYIINLSFFLIEI
jgi:hypothetical protein